MDIRLGTVADAQAMSDILRAIIARTGRVRPSDPEFVRSQYLECPDGIRCSVAVDTVGRVVGFQSLKRAVAGNRYDVLAGWGIIGTHISPVAHRCGVGRALFRSSRQAAEHAGLRRIDASIAADNPTALGYYEAMGFRTYCETEGIVQKLFELEPFSV